MSLLCFSMNFTLTEEEDNELAHITIAAYNAWVLVNDYFSWDKEVHNYEANGSKGEIVSAVFLFMRWHHVDARAAKVLLRKEIIAREQTYADLKERYLSRGTSTERMRYWFTLLDVVTAGNFAWSMTTARYLRGEDPYPGLRSKHHASGASSNDDLDEPISQCLELNVNGRSNGHVNGGNGEAHPATNAVSHTKTTACQLPAMDLAQHEEVSYYLLVAMGWPL